MFVVVFHVRVIEPNTTNRPYDPDNLNHLNHLNMGCKRLYLRWLERQIQDGERARKYSWRREWDSNPR